MEKRMVNITFQGAHPGMHPRWENVPIVYVLKNVPHDKDISELCDCVSTLFGYTTVRTARLFLNEEITSKSACKHSGGYYQSYPKN